MTTRNNWLIGILFILLIGSTFLNPYVNFFALTYLFVLLPYGIFGILTAVYRKTAQTNQHRSAYIDLQIKNSQSKTTKHMYIFGVVFAGAMTYLMTVLTSVLKFNYIVTLFKEETYKVVTISSSAVSFILLVLLIVVMSKQMSNKMTESSRST